MELNEPQNTKTMDTQVIDRKYNNTSKEISKAARYAASDALDAFNNANGFTGLAIADVDGVWCETADFLQLEKMNEVFFKAYEVALRAKLGI